MNAMKVSESGKVIIGQETISAKVPITEIRESELRVGMIESTMQKIALEQELKILRAEFKAKIKDCNKTIVDFATILR